jgi:membrane fusion protein, multidrug efflux system
MRMNVGAACALCAVFLLSLTTACEKADTKTVPEEKVYNVQVRPAEKRSLRPFVESIGTLYPNDEVTVSTEVDGILKSVLVDEGAPVSKDMLLAVVDDTDYNLEVKRAEAAVLQGEATLANTRLEFQRKESLYLKDLVPKQDLDNVATRLSLAEAEVDRAKAALALARQKLGKSKVYAPLAGFVRVKRVSRGEFVKNGSPLFMIIQSNPIKLRFTMTEADVGKVKIGQDVSMRVDALPEREFKGEVRTIYPSLDEKTRTLMVEALVPNPEGELKPGLFAKAVLFTGESRETVVIPITALLYEETRVKAFVEAEGRAKERRLKVGSKYGEFMEIVDGLAERENVVVAGQQSLSEGVKLNVAR